MSVSMKNRCVRYPGAGVSYDSCCEPPNFHAGTSTSVLCDNSTNSLLLTLANNFIKGE